MKFLKRAVVIYNKCPFFQYKEIYPFLCNFLEVKTNNKWRLGGSSVDADKLLYEQFLKGDTLAFEQLVLKHKDNLIYFLQRYVKDIYQCEDIAQDVFAYIFVFKEKYNFKASFKTFLFTIGRNKAVDYIRKNNRLVCLDETGEQQSEDEDLLQKVIRDETTQLVHVVLKKLKSEYQIAICLVDFEEMSYQDAATVMGKTVAQFKILLFRARKALKISLGKEGYTHEN